MTLGTRPCSCGGDNPNCYKCWGTGMVSLRSSPGESQGSYLGARLALKPEQCTVCDAQVLGLRFHMQKAHGPEPVAKRKKTKKSSSRPKVKSTSKSNGLLHSETSAFAVRTQVIHDPATRTCVVCGVPIDNLYRHFLSTGHSPGSSFKKHSSRGSDAPHLKNKKNKAKCNRCGERFPNAALLEAHVLNMHGSEALRREKVQSRSGGQPAEGESHRGFDPIQQGSHLDDKKHWEHSFRDHGQYGSYPSHDDMDDESSA